MPWPQLYLRPELAWRLTQGAGVTVAVVGTGVDAHAPALKGRLSNGPSVFDPHGVGRDCVGHGTFVAGLIAGARQQGAGFSGMAPKARILAVSVTDVTGDTTANLIAKGLNAAVDSGAQVIDVAVAVDTGSEALRQAVRRATDNGLLVVAPATMDTQASSGAVYPAAYPGVVSVAAIGAGGQPLGNGAQGAPVDLVAPGDTVMSAGPGGGYFTGTGASFATAFVAGTAALVLDYRPRLTLDQLVHRLKATAYAPGTALPQAQLGYGCVDPVGAVASILPEERSASPSPRPAAAGPRLAMPPRPDHSAERLAAMVGGFAAGVVALVALAVAVVPRGRLRHWRPGRYRAPS
ncbi:S8 family serine peptidase [Streptomyces sp. BK340]|uniref:S8 family serine peptidase n=1 Tax=Streptomyces sp. BK340 TaxID=2572903 RepID=UPI0016458F19|nr:S8 family serine peptidase [Streptomyces sp. BK340]